MKNFIQVSPLKILEKSSHKGLGKGNLGVLMARAGVGKTACLIHIAFDKLFRKESLVHVSLEDVPEKITSYYNVIFYDLVKALDMKNEHEIRMLFERNRMILSYLNKSFDIGRLRRNLKKLVENSSDLAETKTLIGPKGGLLEEILRKAVSLATHDHLVIVLLGEDKPAILRAHDTVVRMGRYAGHEEVSSRGVFEHSRSIVDP